ncbi:MAG: hypothetical protein Q8O89_03385 [Nanoarchaeota archaeon]|nr:hypothetical protein [Nanoarchaeota archaeon]
MEEADLLKIALVVSITGLFILSIVSSKLVAEEKTLAEIDDFDESIYVTVKGIVSSVERNDKTTVIEIQEVVRKKVIVFWDVDDVAKGDSLIVEGKIDEYKGTKQIIGDNIVKQKPLK